MTPALMMEKASVSAWISLLLSALFFSIPLFLFLRVINFYPGVGMVELTQKLLGKVLGTIVILLFFLSFFIGTSFDLRTHVDITSTLYLLKTPTLFLYFILLVGVYFIAKNGVDRIARTSYVIIVWIKVILLFLILLMWERLDFSFLFPLLGNGFVPLVKTGMSYIGIFKEVLLMALFMSEIRTTKTYSKGALLSFFILTVELTAFWLFYIMLYDFPAIEEITFLFHETTRLVSVGRFLTNPETFFLPAWLLGTYIRFSFCLLVLTHIYTKIFHMKDGKPIMMLFAAMILVVGLLPQDLVEGVYRWKDHYVIPVESALTFSYPILLWVVWKWKKRRT